MQGTMRSNKSIKKLNTSGITHITGMSIMKDVLAGNIDRGGIRLTSHEKEESVINQSEKGITPGQMFKNMRNKKKSTNGEKVIKIRIKSR
jgi:hypothetical protein